MANGEAAVCSMGSMSKAEMDAAGGGGRLNLIHHKGIEHAV